MADHFNAQTYLVTRNVEDGLGDKVAVRGSGDDGGTTYAALDELCGVVAAALREAGVRCDDRVLLMMADGLPMLRTILGAFRPGAVAVPVSTMQTPTELGAVLADSGARLVVCTPQFAEAVEGALPMAPEVERIVVVGDPTLGVPSGVAQTSWDDFLASGRSAPAEQRAAADTDADAWALWLYTSGTTGLPKAAMHRHANIRHVCETYGQQVLGIVPGDVTFSVAKLFFAYGIGNSLFFPFSVGASTVLEPRRPTPQVVQERMERERPTLFFAVPTFFAALVASDIADDTFASVRWCASAGEPLPSPLQKRFTDRFGVEILDGIGSTEALHIFLSNRPGDIRPGTTGRPVPGYDVEVREESGSVVAAGQPGALFVRGESIALGYWRRTDATRLVFQGQWLSAGAAYVGDADGYFHCLGRNMDLLTAWRTSRRPA